MFYVVVLTYLIYRSCFYFYLLLIINILPSREKLSLLVGQMVIALPLKCIYHISSPESLKRGWKTHYFVYLWPIFWLISLSYSFDPRQKKSHTKKGSFMHEYGRASSDGFLPTQWMEGGIWEIWIYIKIQTLHSSNLCTSWLHPRGHFCFHVSSVSWYKVWISFKMRPKNPLIFFYLQEYETWICFSLLIKHDNGWKTLHSRIITIVGSLEAKRRSPWVEHA